MSKFASVFTIVLFCSLALASGRVESEPLPSVSKEFIQQSDCQKNAVMAQEALITSWGYDQEGDTLYPESFAGFWIEGNLLAIGITEYTEDVMDSYRDLSGSYCDYLKFVEMKYSYNYLYNESHIIGAYLIEQGAPVSQHYVDEKENTIVVGLACDEEELIRWKQVIENEFKGIPVTFAAASYIQMLTTNLIGGTGLYNSTHPAGMTLSCCGTYNGNNAILTCGHYTQAYGDQIKTSSSGSVIGTVVKHRFNNDLKGDFEIVSVNTSLFNITRSMAYYRTYNGYLSDPLVGVNICYYSRMNSGEFGETVHARNIDVYAKENPQSTTTVHVLGLTEITLSSGNITQGDSGGPVYRVDNSYAVYCGVIHGIGVRNGNVYVYFTPCKHITPTGFIPYVND